MAAATACVPLSVPASPAEIGEEIGAVDLDPRIAEGRRWWWHSPDPADPVACATCHFDAAATRGWAASFPKFAPVPPPHARVMTLLQRNAEALERHYGLQDPLAAATAITAYLTWHGAGIRITPGVAEGQPVFPQRMQALAISVRRGGRVFAARCGGCHAAAAVAPSVTAFPRPVDGRTESLETFLEGHHSGPSPLRWDGQEMADVIAYLNAQIAGTPLGLGPAPVACAREVPP